MRRKTASEREYAHVKVFKDEYALLGVADDMSLAQINECARVKMGLPRPKRMRRGNRKNALLSIIRKLPEEKLEQLASEIAENYSENKEEEVRF